MEIYPDIKPEQNIRLSEPLSGEIPPESESSHFSKLQKLKNTLAIAGISALAILGIESLEAPSEVQGAQSPNHQPALPQASHADTQPSTPTNSIDDQMQPLDFGIATYSWWVETGPQMFKTMESTGMSVVRLNMVREACPNDLSVLQHESVSAEANGIETVVLLQQGSAKPEPGYAEWAANMASQLPDVQRFIIQNEPNGPTFWKGTMKQYANQLHQTYVAMHAARPDVIVSGVGLDSIDENDPEGWLQRFMRYTTEKFGSPHEVMDTLSVHLYRTPAKDEEMITEYEDLWDGPINIDEFGRIVKNEAAGYNPPGAITPAQQAEDYAEFITWAGNDPQIRSIENYHLENPTNPNDLHTGLITPAGVPMPVLRAIRSTLRDISTGL